ncbi:uncharacterized protein LOC132903670 [Amyelois transitella]|uniref:uncharacterized protein LOC132901872 n=1 Tax=Amyelois transitella TaxID=680683 RepID=UPI0029903FE6|nr:uncharacterized protein LOC132901872 [Amyelois transitella]XP_060804577.1 uncharacterized protein LOC132902649 [Amyelois transitella]XP_060806028.1 uncharacterized protein LOC132902961 [Amyelois transitella]XP_060808441.1 uncharacterized protein LOC132903670 [Amyelois transitella]
MEPSSSGTSNKLLFITRKELISIMNSSGENSLEQRYMHLIKELEKRIGCDFEYMKKKLSAFKSQYKSRWAKASRTENKFSINNKEWLETSISFPRTKSTLKRGRPVTSFENSSDNSKRAKTKQLRESMTSKELVYAACMSLRSEGQVQASKVIKDISKHPEQAKAYKEAYQKSLKPQELVSAEDALSDMIEAKLSREAYNVIRRRAPEKFPSYKLVQAAKKLCYPHDITVTETSASVKLQSLLDHTSMRLCQTLIPVINTLNDDLDRCNEICLVSKWGFDGSSGHSSYKQAFQDSAATDSAVFITCLVPLRLVANDIVIWQNPSPASTRYCRPIKIEFQKESVDVSIQENREIENQISNLRESTVNIENKTLKIRYELILSMVDGKVCNALTETTSTMKCFLCGATSKLFNNIDEMVKRDVNTDNLRFGLSILHGWIRCFECLLHLAYKLPIARWQARGKDDKQIVSENKTRIQTEFRKKCGLIVDKPKPGFGNSNDGNTARRFFQNPELSAEITHIDIDLIKKMHIILITISSGFDIDSEKYRLFALNTARYFVSLYPWYNMPPTLHKYLIHGPEIISFATLPIGQLTEESQEARNKDFKRYREHHSRKCSRQQSNRDIFNFFLLSSDPVITSKQKPVKNKVKNIPQEALFMLKAPSPNKSVDKGADYDYDDDDDDDDDDDGALTYL